MDDTTGYNGWCNYETWLVNVWLCNDEASYLALEAIKADGGSMHHKAEQLEELVRELYEFEPVGIVADLVNTAFTRVSWVDIVSAE